MMLLQVSAFPAILVVLHARPQLQSVFLACNHFSTTLKKILAQPLVLQALTENRSRILAKSVSQNVRHVPLNGSAKVVHQVSF